MYKRQDLKGVLEARLYSNEKVWENLEAEIMGVIIRESLEIIPFPKVVEIDTSNQSPQQTAEQIHDLIEGGDAPDTPIIDWVENPKTLRLLLSRPCTL